MAPEPRYDEPFFWWGPGWDIVRAPRVADLLRDQTISSWQAAVLWAALCRRISLVVIAGPSGAGKTTLLTALLEFLPPGTQRIFPRGSFETFRFLADPVVVPNRTALLVNEISPHLPVYHWGDAVHALLDAADSGFMLLATAHAESVPEFVALLTGSPLRIPTARVAAFELVVVMEPSATIQRQSRVHEIWQLEATRDGVVTQEIARACQNDISQEFTLGTHRIPISEIHTRRQLLDQVRDGRTDRLPSTMGPIGGRFDGVRDGMP